MSRSKYSCVTLATFACCLGTLDRAPAAEASSPDGGRATVKRAKGKTGPVPAGAVRRGRSRRRAPLPDWAKESWFVRRQADAPWCIQGVNVIDVRTGTIHPDTNIVIRGDVIESVGATEVPEDTRIVNLTGAYVIPGLFDLHAHVMPKWDLFPTSKEPEETLEQLLDFGVTTIRAIPLYSESAVMWKAMVGAGHIPGPTIVPTSSVFEKTPQRTSSGFGDPATARQWVRKEALAGCRWIKVYDAMDEPSLEAIVKTARAYGMRVCGHTSLVPPHRASEIGLATVEHSIGIAYSTARDGQTAPTGLFGLSQAAWYWRHADPEKCAALMRLFKENETGWVPTLVVTEKIVRNRAHHFTSVPSDVVKQLEGAMRTSAMLALDLHRMGGLVGVGTDFPVDNVQPGESVHRELELLVELGGASPLEALQMATISSATILGFEDLLGSVESGKIANLVILEDNPLENISNTRRITHVVHDGRLREIHP